MLLNPALRDGVSLFPRSAVRFIAVHAALGRALASGPYRLTGFTVVTQIALVGFWLFGTHVQPRAAIANHRTGPPLPWRRKDMPLRKFYSHRSVPAS